MLARLGIGVVVGGVVYTFLASTIVPFINNTISQLLSQSNQLLNLGGMILQCVNYIGIPSGIALVAATWSICLALNVFKASLSFVKAVK
jgi:hypothetical protein